MMRKMKFLVLLISVFMLFMACEKDDKADITPPGIVNTSSATPKNQAVLLSWTNPVDDDFATTKIVYDGKTIEVAKTNESKLIEQLENGKEYSFEIHTTDLNGNNSESVIIKSTPDKYVTTVEGQNVISGTFNGVKTWAPIEIVINNNEYKRTMTGGTAKYIWKGNWLKENDSTHSFTYEYYTDDYRGIVHIANMVDKANAAFCYTNLDTTFYVEFVYEKIEGDINFLTGKYKYYRKTISADEPSFNKTTYYYANFTEDGAVTYSDSKNNTETSSWTNQDLLDGKFLFVLLNSKTYLINREKINRYQKK